MHCFPSFPCSLATTPSWYKLPCWTLKVSNYMHMWHSGTELQTLCELLFVKLSLPCHRSWVWIPSESATAGDTCRKKVGILENPLSRLLCSYNILDSAVVRRFPSSAVIGFALCVGFKPVSQLLSLCSFLGTGGALNHQTSHCCSPDIPFPVGVIEFAQRCSQWAGDERCHWRALLAGFLSPQPVSTNPFVSLSLSINKFSQYFEGLFITPANTRHLTLYPQRGQPVCALPQSSYCKYLCIVAWPLCEIQMPFADY